MIWRGPHRWLVAPVVLVTAGACLASQSDIRVLQQDLAVMRAEQARADSARRVQLDSVAQVVAVANDSLRALSRRMARFTGDVRGELYSLGQQLLQVQELTGQSQRRLQEMRASLEARQQQASQPASTPAGPAAADTTRTPSPTAGAAGAAAAPPPAPIPGPNQLFQLALDQLRRGSTRTARTGFTDLLRQYPTADVAGEAQYYVGETFRQEGNLLAADSVYILVVSKYPRSERAPTALYKHAQHLEAIGQDARARAAYQQLIRDYPRSDEAVLARERMR